MTLPDGARSHYAETFCLRQLKKSFPWSEALLTLRRADQVQHAIIAPEAFNRETETVGSIEHLRKFHKLVCHVIGLSFHLQHRRSRRNTERCCLRSTTTHHFYRVFGPGQHDTVALLQCFIQRPPLEIDGLHARNKPRRNIGGKQGNGLALAQSNALEVYILLVIWAKHASEGGGNLAHTQFNHAQGRTQPFSTHALGETG